MEIEGFYATSRTTVLQRTRQNLTLLLEMLTRLDLFGHNVNKAETEDAEFGRSPRDWWRAASRVLSEPSSTPKGFATFEAAEEILARRSSAPHKQSRCHQKNRQRARKVRMDLAGMSASADALSHERRPHIIHSKQTPC